MIVQCPSCSKRYRVNDANIPPSGGKIRCPECSHAFVVYPEPAADPAAHHDPGEKTSVAQRPNMEELLKGMKGSDAGGGEQEVAKTEVMSGSELPDFSNLFGGNSDQTTEMPSPLRAGGALNSLVNQGSSSPPVDEDDLRTEQLSADIVQKSLGHVRGQAQGAAPAEDSDNSMTEVVPPSMLDEPPGGSTGPVGGPSAPPAGAPGTPPSSNAGPSTNFQTGGQGQVSGGPAPQGGSSAPAPPSSNPAPPSSNPAPPSSNPAPPSSSPAPPSSNAAPPSSNPAPPAAGPDASHDGPWKLETNFGLTYEFADNQSLRNWLSSREDLDGYKLSADGHDFYPLTAFPQFQPGGAASSASPQQMASSGQQSAVSQSGGTPQRRDSYSGPGSSPGRPPSGPGSHSGPLPPPSNSGPLPPPSGMGAAGGGSPFRTASSPGGMPAGAPGPQAGPDAEKEVINPNEMYRPPSRDSALLNGILWGAFVVLGIAAVVLALQLVGVIDLIGDDEEPQEFPEREFQRQVVEEPEVEAEDDGEARSQRMRREVDRLVESARADIESNRLGSALERLERAIDIDPERVVLYEMKAEIHDDLGEEDEAEALRTHAEELQEAQQAALEAEGQEEEELDGEEGDEE